MLFAFEACNKAWWHMFWTCVAFFLQKSDFFVLLRMETSSSGSSKNVWGSLDPNDFKHARSVLSSSHKESIVDVIHKITKETDDLPLKGKWKEIIF